MFHGKEVQAAEINAVRYRATEFAPAFATQPHAHEAAYFCFVLGGASVQVSGGIERTRRRGEVFFYPAGERQSERFGPAGSRLLSIELASLARLGDAPRRSVQLGGAAESIARKLYGELVRDDTASPLAIEGLTLGLCAELLRVPFSAPAWVSRVREFLHEHYAEPLALADVAAVAGVHPVHLSRDFPLRFGTTLCDYVRGLRIDQASRALIATDRSIAEIALDAGFDSQAHFTRHFKARMGTTPAAFRAGRR
jgi:AraC family transcriptional regulator